jgi:hypothetical protein
MLRERQPPPARPAGLGPQRPQSTPRPWPQPFTIMYLATFPFFSFRSKTAPCSTPSV